MRSLKKLNMQSYETSSDSPVIAVSSCFTCCIQPIAHISGTVADRTGQPLAFQCAAAAPARFQPGKRHGIGE